MACLKHVAHLEALLDNICFHSDTSYIPVQVSEKINIRLKLAMKTSIRAASYSESYSYSKY